MLNTDFEPDLLAAVAARGITHLELYTPVASSLFEADEAVLAVTDVARRHDLVFWSVHAPFGGEVDLSQPDELPRRHSVQCILRALEIAERVDAGMLVIHAGLSTGDEEERGQRLKQAIRSVNELVKRSSQAGVGLALEYLPTNKERICNSSQDCHHLLRYVDGAPGICMDTNHANLGEPLAQAVTALGDRIATLHISDNDGVEERHLMPGQGTIDWAEFVGLLDDIGYTGALIYEASQSSEDITERLDMTVSSARQYLGWEPE
jgi:sugar phosphate isomerase/epimerase